MSTPNLGYRFEPTCEHDDPCHRQLTVWLRTAPTEKHFDPRSVHCLVAPDKGGSGRLEITHPWPNASNYRLYAGRIMLKDRVGKEVEAFTFGGELNIESNEVTTCVFKSPAPLIPLLESESRPGNFANEVEVVLAERRAHWEMQGALDKFEKRLGEMPPFSLYVTCLAAVEDHARALGSSADEQTRQALRFVQRQRAALKEAGQWPGHVPTVDEAL